MKRVRINFNEAQRAITTDVTIEYEGENIPSNDEILEEELKLFDKCCDESHIRTMRKVNR